MEDTDGCSEQYRYASSLYFMNTISMKYGIMIGSTVGTPGHGKDVVDGLSTVDNRYLRAAILRDSIPREDKNVKTRNCHSATTMGCLH
eukprot:10857577-Ditylum_brightwellii.AAC.1